MAARQTHPTIVFRPATATDCNRVFQWRNDPAVRQYANNPEPLSPEAHEHWFEQTLANPMRCLWIAETDGRSVGVLRYDLSPLPGIGQPDLKTQTEGTTATDDLLEALVSVYLAPDCIGQGYGAPLLQAGSVELKRQYPHVIRILAEIRLDNTASLKVFSRAGFLPCQTAGINDTAPAKQGIRQAGRETLSSNPSIAPSHPQPLVLYEAKI